MTETFTITRRLEIDMGHRVPDHGSKCRNLHGHRYVIEAKCEGPLAEAGEQNGMVVDFGFLKRVMVEQIEKPFDHRLCLFRGDPLLSNLFGVDLGPKACAALARGEVVTDFGPEVDGQALTVVDAVPTAENLAAIWFAQMAPHVELLTDGRARLIAVTVHETPNCMATVSL